MVVFIPTCRFFSSPASAACLSNKGAAQEDSPQALEPRAASPTQDNSPSTQTNDSDGPDVPSLDTPSPPPSPSTTSPTSASQGLRLFHWSGSSTSPEQSTTPKSTSGLAALQQFQYKKESFSLSTNTHRSPGDTSPPHMSSGDGNPEDDLPDSPPSQDSAYFSQSQPSDLTSCHKEEVPTSSFPSSYQVDAASVCSHKSPPPFYKCLYVPCGWVSLRTYIHHLSFMTHEWVCRRLTCLSCASSGNEFKQRFGAGAQSHTVNGSR